MSGFRVVALVSAFNEADILPQVVTHLIEQGIDVYLLDHGSTDGTVASVEPLRGRGLLGIESTADRKQNDGGLTGWADILARKEQLASEIAADWFIHADADEFRDSPWADRTLREAVRAVDRNGFNAIDFEVFTFWPTQDGFVSGCDVQEVLPYYDTTPAFNKTQVRCWQFTGKPVDLVSSGGHQAIFPDRRVFPIRFILRHYPIRSQSHGERKVFHDRERFKCTDRDRGWHRQYDGIAAGHRFLRDPSSLTRYDPDAARLYVCVHNRLVDECRGDLQQEHVDEQRVISDRLRHELDSRNRMLESSSAQLHQRNLECERLAEELDARNQEGHRLAQELDARNHEAERLGRELDARNRECERLGRELDARNRECERLGRELDARNRECERLGRQLVERDRDAERVRDDLMRQIDALNERLVCMEERAAIGASEVAAARHHLQAVYDSASWRITTPMRAAWRLVRRGPRRAPQSSQS